MFHEIDALEKLEKPKRIHSYDLRCLYNAEKKAVELFYRTHFLGPLIIIDLFLGWCYPAMVTREGFVRMHQVSNQFITVHDKGQIKTTRLGTALPARGCEVLVSRLPRNILMQKFHDFMALCGEIHEIRLLLDSSGYNKGMGYVQYCKKEAARMAVLLLNACEIIPGHAVMIKMSFDTNILILSNVPEHITEPQVFQEMNRRIGNGLSYVTLEKSANSYCKTYLLSYETHRQALEAREALWPGLQLWDCFVLIEWAVPQDLKLARVLYFRNFPEYQTKREFFDFLRSVLDIDTVLKIQIHRGEGYIVFSSDRHRSIAKNVLADRRFLGSKLEVQCKKFKAQSFLYRASGETNPSESATKHSDFSALDGRQTCFDFMLDAIPAFVLTPVYTKPGIYNELDAIIHLVTRFLSVQFPFTTWTVLDSIVEETVVHSPLIRLMAIVNEVKYTFLLVQVSPY